MGYNKGDTYEEKIFDICKDRKAVYPGTERAGAGTGADICLSHKKKKVRVEVKSKGADWGGKYLDFASGSWFWQNPDTVTSLYDEMGLIEMIDPTFVPRNANHDELPVKEWNKLRKLKIKQEDKQYDNDNFERRTPCSLDILFEYYKKKNCFYIQLEGFGFYHLYEDNSKLNTPQFDGEMVVRFRNKTQHAHAYYVDKKKISTKKKYNEKKDKKDGHDFKIVETPWDTTFSAVMKLSKKPTPSQLNLEKSVGQDFPNLEA
jgi:hypothetical protein